MPPQHKQDKLNDAIRWIYGKLVTIHKMREQADDPDAVPVPNQLHIRELVPAIGCSYNTLLSWSIYREIESRFKCLSYAENRGRWALDPGKIQDDLEEDRDAKLL